MTKNNLAAEAPASPERATKRQRLTSSSELDSSFTTTTSSSAANTNVIAADKHSISNSTMIAEVQGADHEMADDGNASGVGAVATQSADAHVIQQGQSEQKKADQEKQPSRQDDESQREIRAGITQFVNPDLTGFQGILKQRYTDFLVNEIALDGNVLHLTDDRAPNDKAVAKERQSQAQGNKPTAVPAEPLPAEPTHDVAPSSPVKSQQVDASGKDTKDSSAANNTAQNGKSDTVPLLIPVKNDTKQAEVKIITAAVPVTFDLAPEDEAILMDYFGEDFKNEILQFHEKILSKPSAKPRDLGSILSAPFASKEKRGRLHGDVRRIFKSRFETEFVEGSIKFSAAAKSVVASHGKPPGYSTSNQNVQGGRSNANQTKGKVGWDELGGQHLHFSLYKENKDTMEVISYLARMLKVKPRDFAFSGTKDRRAVTVQRVSVYRQHAPTLARLNPTIRNARIGNFSYERNGLSLGELNGNFFTIALRDCHFVGEDGSSGQARMNLAQDVMKKGIEHAQKHGFLNYFGLQRFGTFVISNDVVGAMILRNDFEGAVNAILDFNPELLEMDAESADRVGRDDLNRAQAIHMFKTSGHSQQALNTMPKRFSGETSVIRHLGNRNTKTDFIGALRMINRNLKLMYVHAYQSLVWNAAASERWERYGDKVVEGDLVMLNNETATPEVVEDEVDENGEIIVHPAQHDVAMKQDNFERARPLTAEEAQSGKYTIFDIVLPTPGFDVEYPQNEVGDFYKEFMASERGGRLDPANMRRGEKDFSLSGNYRKLINRMEDLSYEVKWYHAETEQLTETDLEKLEKTRPKQENRNGNQQYGNNERFNNREQQNTRGGRGGFATSRGGNGQQGRERFGRNNPNDASRVTGDIRLEDPSFINSKAPPVDYAAAEDAKRTLGEQAAAEHAAKIAAWHGFQATEEADLKAKAEGKAARIAAGEIEEQAERPVIEETWIQTRVTADGQREVVGKNTELIDQDGLRKPLAKHEPLSETTKQLNASSATKAERTQLAGTTGDSLPTTVEHASASVSDMASNGVAHDQLTELRVAADVDGGIFLEPKIAVIIKFALGPSTYATMALRELMKAGGVSQYKPDFSLGR